MGTSSILAGLVLIAAHSTAAIGSSADVLDGFRDPAASYKAKFRYWLPDASTDPNVVRQDVHAMANVGAGGFEFLPYYQFGPAATNWSEFGYGSAAYKPLFRAAMEAAEEEGLLMDFAVGANQGQGVPAAPESTGLAVHLTYSNVTVEAGTSFNGTLPLSRQPADQAVFFMHALEEFGTQKLSVVLGVEVLPDQDSSSRARVVGRTIDLTALVDLESRALSWTAPESSAGATWRIMAWYERFTNQRSINPGPDARGIIQNGSWIVDHFSADGADIMTKFFDDYIVPDEEDRQLLRKVGNYAWEDSMEMTSTLWWTPRFATKFETHTGYSINTCLPLLLNMENGWAQSNVPFSEPFTSSNATASAKCNEDYRLVLQESYEEYIAAKVKWSRERGVRYSNQPADNLPLNILKSVPLVDAPEGESWGFRDNIDKYRYFSSAAHVTGNPVVSSECGAINNGAYTQTIGDLLRSVHRGMAGGISMHVFHGYPYSGPFADTTWPGVAIFGFQFTEMWGPRQPVWEHMSSMMSYVARNQFVSQIGTAKVDLAVYSYAAPWSPSAGYGSDNLRNAGFTYDYLGPNNFEDERAVLKDGVLFPEGPSYKALLFIDKVPITLAASARIELLATEGLPMIFVGETVPRSIGSEDAESEELSSVFDRIFEQNLPNVVRVESIDDVTKTLQDKLNIDAQASFVKDGSAQNWYSFWRSTPEAELVWLYNDNNAANGSTVRFDNVAGYTPYILDAWTGNASAVIQYQEDENDILIPVSLQTNQTTIFAFKKPSGCRKLTSLFGPKLRTHVKSTTGAVVDFAYSHDTRAPQVDVLFTHGPVDIEYADGKTLTLEGQQIPPTSLATWDLEIEDWHRPENSSSVQPEIGQIELKSIELAPWNELQLANVSGVGTYTTSFSAPPIDAKLGARLHLGYVRDSVVVWLNGEQVSHFDHHGGQDTVVDLPTFYAKASDGESTVNELKVEVRTTLLNRVKAEKDNIRSMGGPPGSQTGSGSIYDTHPVQRNGLLGPVWIEWLNVARVI